jgi:Protein of unknown function (DUF2948)
MSEPDPPPRPDPAADLKLVAFDAEDLAIVSAHLQDAVVRIADLAYLPREQRFAALLNRFDWVAANAAPGSGGNPVYKRRRAALRFERVVGAKLQGIDLKAKRHVMSLLAIGFEAKAPDDPAGHVTLVFAGGAAIRLQVECLEAEFRDLGAAWSAKRKPGHPDDSP